jgi:hypothetical protein
MTAIKNARRTATTIKIRSRPDFMVTRSRDPYLELMLRLFQDETTAQRGRKFLGMVEEREKAGEPMRTREWKRIIEELGVGRSAFYAMRNKLLGAGMITSKGGEYKLAGSFSRDLVDMARWWWTAVLGNSQDSL